MKKKNVFIHYCSSSLIQHGQQRNIKNILVHSQIRSYGVSSDATEIMGVMEDKSSICNKN